MKISEKPDMVFKKIEKHFFSFSIWFFWRYTHVYFFPSYGWSARLTYLLSPLTIIYTPLVRWFRTVYLSATYDQVSPPLFQCSLPCWALKLCGETWSYVADRSTGALSIFLRMREIFLKKIQFEYKYRWGEG